MLFRSDERFNAALSVVDLDLTSVLCVPVRDASGLLGALYLDHCRAALDRMALRYAGSAR